MMSTFRRRSVAFALIVIALGALVVPGPAGAAKQAHLAAFFIDYAPKSVDLNQGDSLVFTNTDPFSGQGHTVTHNTAPGQEPLFDSGVVPLGESVDIPGIPNLKPGDYLITCRVHPIMRGFVFIGGPPRPPTDTVWDFLF